MGVSGQRQSMVALPPGAEAGCAPKQVCKQTEEQNETIVSTGNRPPVVQPVSPSFYLMNYPCP
jgi:hypothetical protein